MENGSQMTFEQLTLPIFPELTCGASDSLVRTSALPESKSDFTETVQACFSELCTFLDSKKKKRDPLTCSLRMLKIFCLLMEDGISPDFSLKWIGGGTMQNGVFSTLKTLEYHRTENAVSLSDVLEEEVDERYFLSNHATSRLLSYKDAKVIRE